jgi:hypothetical protein
MLENKVEKKEIVQIDLDNFFPTKDSLAYFDIQPFLVNEWLLKEKEFRTAMDEFNFEQYRSKNVLIHCSNQAIIPQWSYMLIADFLTKVDATGYFNKSTFEENVLIFNISKINLDNYKGKRVLLKGCSKPNISSFPYIYITQLLSPIVKSLAYGESCSMVPILKNSF